MTGGNDKSGILTAAALFLALAVISTWPLATDPANLDLASRNNNDARFNTYIVFWGAHALLTDPLNLHHTNMFHPERYTFAYSDIELSSSLLMLPAIMAWYNPVLTYNLLVLASILLGGIGFFLLARDLTGSRAAALFAAAVFVFNPTHFGRHLQIQFFADQWLPWLAWALLRWIKGGSWGWALTSALFFCLHALTGSHNAVFGSVFLGLTLLFYALAKKLWKEGRFWVGVVVIVMVSAAVLLPVFWPYLIVEQELKEQRVEDFNALRAGSAGPQELLSAGSRFYYWVDDNLGWPSALFDGKLRGSLFPGFVAILLGLAAFFTASRKVEKENRTGIWINWLAWLLDITVIAAAWVAAVKALTGAEVIYIFIAPLPSPPALLTALAAIIAAATRLIWLRRPEHALIALWKSASRRFSIDTDRLFWLIVFLFGVIAALGPDAGLYQILGRLPLVKLIRVPRRFIMLAAFALAALCAWGFAALIKRIESRIVRTLLAGIVVVVFAAESLYAPLNVYKFNPTPPELFTWLGRQDGDFAVAEFPVDPLNYAGSIRRVYYSIYHWKKLLVGYSGYQSPGNRERLRRLNDEFPSDACLNELRGLDVRYVIVLEDRLAPEQVAELKTQKGLLFVRDFGGSRVYRLRTSAGE
jgi:hypothetical protein